MQTQTAATQQTAALPAPAPKANHERIELLIALALLHAEHGQPRRALTYALLAHTFAPGDALARRMLAFALLRNGAAAEALETLTPLVDARTPDPEIDLLHAEILRALDHSEAATDAFWRAIGARSPASAAQTAPFQPTQFARGASR